MSTSEKTLCLIDGSGFIFRAFYALPPLTRPDGTPVGAVFGFTSMLMSLIETHKHHLWAVIFDAKRQNFRHEIFSDYKANRESPPPELVPQFSLIREVCKAFDVPSVELEGYEADDLIATYAHQASQSGYNVKIISGDKDLMQLMNDNIELFDPIKNRTINNEDVLKKFGVTPDKVSDVQALMGDTSDNIPGIPGIGPKTASELIKTYGDLESLLNNSHTIPQVKRRELLKTHAENARMSKQLSLLKVDVPVTVPYTDLQPNPMNHNKIMEFIQAQGFQRLKARVLNFFSRNSSINDSTLPLEKRTHATPEFKLVNTLSELETICKQLSNSGTVAIDTETDGLNTFNCQLVGISLAWSRDSAVYIPLNHKDEHGNRLDDQLSINDIQPLLSAVLEHPGLLKVGHNLKFDSEVLAQHNLIIKGPIHDTMVMSYAMNMGKHGHGLDELSLKYFAHPMIPFKEAINHAPKIGRKTATFDYVPTDKATIYAAEDAWMTLMLFDTLSKELATEKRVRVYETLDRPLVQVIIDMETRGIKIDAKYLDKLTHSFELKCNELEQKIFQLAGKEFNVGSPKQLSEVLFEELNLPTKQKKGKSGSYSTDSDALSELNQQGHLIAEHLLSWRHYNKLISTYTKALPEKINPKTGRVHTNFGLTITTTGRLSSSDPNLQNIPIRTEEGKLIRKAFVAEPGSKIVAFDYSQIELRLLAHMADIQELKSAFNNNEDIHALTASHILNIPIEKVTPENRRNAKAVNFGIIYGISAFGLSNQLKISKASAQSYINAYFERYPGIKTYMDTTIQHAKTHGYVSTLLGHHTYINGIEDRNYNMRNYAERQAINAPIQGSNADIIKKAMIQIDKRINANNLTARMLLQVHDELVFEIPENSVEDEVPLIKQIMENAVHLSVPVIVDYEVATNWADAH